MSSSNAYARARGKSYDETFRCPGGALCLDFCNSGQGMRGSRQSEWISSFGDLVDWLEAAEAIPHAHAVRWRRAGETAPGAATAAWKHAIVLRETLFRVFDAAARGMDAARADLEAIEAAFAATLAASRFERYDEGYAWRLDPEATAPRTIVQPIVKSAVDLLTSGKLSRLRQCGSETCSWLFLDETKNRSRRWCEMASCGNLAKVRRHREKGGAKAKPRTARAPA